MIAREFEILWTRKNTRAFVQQLENGCGGSNTIQTPPKVAVVDVPLHFMLPTHRQYNNRRCRHSLVGSGSSGSGSSSANCWHTLAAAVAAADI